jgi:hypothetical protein
MTYVKGVLKKPDQTYEPLIRDPNAIGTTWQKGKEYNYTEHEGERGAKKHDGRVEDGTEPGYSSVKDTPKNQKQLLDYLLYEFGMYYGFDDDDAQRFMHALYTGKRKPSEDKMAITRVEGTEQPSNKEGAWDRQLANMTLTDQEYVFDENELNKLLHKIVKRVKNNAVMDPIQRRQNAVNLEKQETNLLSLFPPGTQLWELRDGGIYKNGITPEQKKAYWEYIDAQNNAYMYEQMAKRIKSYKESPNDPNEIQYRNSLLETIIGQLSGRAFNAWGGEYKHQADKGNVSDRRLKNILFGIKGVGP